MRTAQTFGPNAVDWENRVDMGRLRTERLARLNAELERSELGALLSFDFANIRYMTVDPHRHLGHGQADPVRRAAARRRAGRLGLRLGRPPPPALQPLAGPHRRPGHAGGRGATGARAGISTLRGAFHPDAGIAEDVAAKVAGGAARARPGRRAARHRRGRDAGAGRAGRGRDPTVDGQQVFMEARRIKTRDEITLLAQACSMVDAAYDELYEFLRPGVRENECVGLVSKVLYDLGSEYVEGVNAISGERCSPHPHVYSRPADPARRPGVLRHPAQLPAATGPATTARSRWAARRGRSATPTPAAASTWTRPSRWSSRAPRPADIVSLWPRAERVRLRRRDGRVRACSTATASACRSGRSRSSAGSSPSTTPRRSRRAWCSRWRPTGPPATAGRRPGSRRNSSSPRTAAR